MHELQQVLKKRNFSFPNSIELRTTKVRCMHVCAHDSRNPHLHCTGPPCAPA